MKQKVMSAIQHKPSGKVPYNVELASEKRSQLCAEIGISESEYFVWAGNHIEKTDFNTGEYIKPGYYKDNFGVVWDRSGLDKDIGIVEEKLVTEDNFVNYRSPDVRLELVTNKVKASIGNGLDTFKLGKISMTLFERAWSLRGLEELLMDFYLNPALVNHLLDQILEYNVKILDIALEHDIDGIYFGDDFGTQTSLIMSPDTWRKFIKPRYKLMFSMVKAKGKITALHSCGNIGVILSDLIDIGLDIYQTVQPEVYDLADLKDEFGKDLSFWGGISTQKLLPYARKMELIDEVKRTIHVMSKDGGYIASPTHQVTPDVSNENVLTLIELLRDGI